MSRRSTDLDTKIYVGDLPREASEKEIERAFSYYGRLRNVWVARNPAGFAFVEFEDPRDADDAVRGLDGTSICGSRVRVEHSNGKVRPKPWLRGGRGPPPRSRRPFNPDDRCYECGERGHYAYDCHRYSRRRRDRSRSHSRSRSYRRSLSHSRSRSRTHSSRRGYRSHTRSRSRSRDQSRDRSRDRSNDRSRERSHDRSVSPANDASP